MTTSCKDSLGRKALKDIKAMLKKLLEVEYYPKRLELQQIHGLHIQLQTQLERPGCVSKATALEEKLLGDISNANGPRSMLVLGDSGTGKTWLALKLAKEMYDSAQPAFQNKVPVYIPLGRIEKMFSQQKIQESSRFRSDILFSYIMNHKNHFPFEDWKLQNLYLDLCTCELILILDGYDELKMKSNLWEENKWKAKDFKDVRTVVFSRPNAFVDVDVSNIFGFSKKQQSNYFISPIMGSIVEKYISQVPLFLHSLEYDSKLNEPWMMTKSITKYHPKWESAHEDSEYKYWFLYRLPELQGLAQNVFILTTICQLLPKLVESERKAAEETDFGDDFLQKLEEICRTEVLLYDKFTQAWFKYQIERMEPTGHAQILYENRHILRHYMVGYAQNLAMRCASLNEGNVLNGEISEGETLYWNLWTPWSPYSKKFNREKNIKLEQILFPQNEKDRDKDRIENLKFLRDSCVLRYNSGCYAFEFIHLSLFEYFLSREVFVNLRGVLNYYSNWNRRKDEVYFPINQKNINDPQFIGVLSMLVGRAKTDEKFQDILLKTIKKSATLPGIVQMASNAFTILNLSGYTFSGRNIEDDNFQNIQVPGANFRNSVCGNSDFSGANFENATLSLGWFQGCKFQGVNFSNCSFGEIPPLSLGTSNQYFVHAMFAYSVETFCHVVVCYEEQCETSDVNDLYVKIYKFQKDFELLDSTSVFLRKLDQDEDHSFFFVENTGSIILLNFIHTLMFASDGQLFPDFVLNYWYEFKTDSLVSCGTLDPSTLSLDFLLNYSNQFDFVPKYIVFFSNEANPVFVEQETFRIYGAASDICSKKYFWFAFGRFKILVSVRFHYSEFGGEIGLKKVLRISMQHNDKPILWNEGSLSFELMWHFASSNRNIQNIDMEIEQENAFDDTVFFSGIFYDGTSHLSFLGLTTMYLFDVKNCTCLSVFKNPKGLHWKSEFLEQSPSKQILFFAQIIDLLQEHKLTWEYSHNIFEAINHQCFISENLNFIGRNLKTSVEVYNVNTEQLLQTVLINYGTPATFFSLKNDSDKNGCDAYLIYVLKNSLHFESLQAFKTHTKEMTLQTSPTRTFISEDGLLSVRLNTEEFPTTRAYFLNFYCSDNGTLRKKSSSCLHLPDEVGAVGRTNCNSVLITSNNILLLYISISNKTASQQHTLIGYNAKTKKFVPIKSQNLTEYVTGSDCSFYLFQRYRKIVFGNKQQLTCYSVTENCSDNEIFLELTCDLSCELSFTSPFFAFDPNIENISYVYDPDFSNKIGVWNLTEKTYTTLTISYVKTGLQHKLNLHTVLQSYTILQGYCDSEYFYCDHVIEYSENSETGMPAQMASSAKLGWIVIQFLNGEIHILDSIQLKTLFVFHGFQSVSKFQIVDTIPTQVQIVVSSDAANLSRLTVNSESLRKCFETGKLSKFKDWKVDNGQNSSSTLSLKGVDISYSRFINNSNLSLLKFHGSLGSPSVGRAYRPFCRLFLPVTEYQHSILVTSKNEQQVDLTKKWIVTVIAKRNKFKLMSKTVCTSMGQHSALIIEGILYGGHFVIRAELTRDRENNINIRCEPYRGKINYEAIIKNFFGKQFEVHPHKGMKLLKNIWVDTYNPQWKYSLLFHNCNSWCREKLKVLNLDSKFNPKLYKLFADLPEDFHLQKLNAQTLNIKRNTSTN